MASKDELRQRTRTTLLEVRIVLPGTQALLGFQLTAFFYPAFQKLAAWLQLVHFTSLLLVLASTILLIAPVAYQQIGEAGHTSRGMLRFSRLMTSIAMGLLLAALAADSFLVAHVIHLGAAVASLTAFGILTLGGSLWYGYTAAKRID